MPPTGNEMTFERNWNTKAGEVGGCFKEVRLRLDLFCSVPTIAYQSKSPRGTHGL